MITKQDLINTFNSLKSPPPVLAWEIADGEWLLLPKKNTAMIEILEKIPNTSIIVVGDIILDYYIYGTLDRISPEAPVPILKVARDEFRLGGAANVAQTVKALGGNPYLIGSVGVHNSDGGKVLDLLHDHSIDNSISRDGCTTIKTRIITQNGQHVLRVDNDYVCQPPESSVISAIERLSTTHKVILISDYGKGFCSPSLIKQIITFANKYGFITIVDPHPTSDLGKYHGATCLKLNRLEASKFANSARSVDIQISSYNDAIKASDLLSYKTSIKNIIITLDKDGLIVNNLIVLPVPRHTLSITGAGDAVLATLGYCLASGTTFHDAAKLANIVGGLSVEQPVTRDALYKELPRSKFIHRDRIVAEVTLQKSLGKKIVLVSGCFDILHVGHLDLFRLASTYGDYILVAINSDHSIRRLKGKDRPINTESDRVRFLYDLQSLHGIVVFDEDTPVSLIHEIKPDVLVKGSEYRNKSIPEEAAMTEIGGVCKFPLMTLGFSSTDIIDRYSNG